MSASTRPNPAKLEDPQAVPALALAVLFFIGTPRRPSL